jgi:hypothetical protein
MAMAGLFAALDFSNVPEDEFHDWYDTEHLPERQRMPGFLTCERWLGVTDPRYSVGSYDLESLEVLASAAYRSISFENASARSKRVTGACKRLLRVECEQTMPGDQFAPAAAGGLLLNAMNVAPEHEDEFNDWLDTEHIPALAKVPGTLCARRFLSRQGSHRYLAVYHLATPDVVGTPEWKKAARTPWTEKLLPHLRDRLRIVCRRYRPAEKNPRAAGASSDALVNGDSRRGREADAQTQASSSGGS